MQRLTAIDSTINYSEKELYDLLIENDVHISAINQIMKLYNLRYPLAISHALMATTEELRHIVSVISSTSKELKRGSVFTLSKDKSLKKCTFAVGWDDVGTKEVDIDMAAFLLDSKGKLIGTHNGVVYFNQIRQDGICIETTINGEEYERISVSFDKLNKKVERIVFALSIFEAENRKENFENIRNLYLRVIDTDKKNEICRFLPKAFSPYDTTLTLAEVYKNGKDLNLRIIDESIRGDLNALITRYI